MKRVRTVLLAAGLVVGLAFFARFFLAQLGGPPATSGPAGVLLGPPPGTPVVELGAADRRRAARELAARLAAQPAAPQLAVHFRAGGEEVFWLADRANPAAPVLVERTAGESGTRLETTWRGALDERLAWAAGRGSLDVPGLPPGERKNLYH